MGKRYVEVMLERDLIAPGGTIICNNPELEQVVLPIRDGVSILRKKPAFSFSPEPRTTSDGIDELDIDTLRKLYLEEKKKNEAQAAELAKLQELNQKLQAEKASNK